MSCCDTPINCRPCSPCTTPSAEAEPLQSALDNFILAAFGEIDKALVNGKVEWTLPCNLEIGLQNNPRLPEEGLFCYLIRLIGGGIVGLTGPAGPTGAPGVNGQNGYAKTLANVAQPTMACPDIVVTVDQPGLFPTGVVASAYIVNSGYYTVVSKLGNQIALRLVIPVSPAPTVIPANSIIVLSGPRGANGATGPAGAPGAAGPAGVAGPTGPAGTNGASGTAALAGAFTMPAFGGGSVWATFDADLRGRPGMFVWLEGAGYLRVTAAAGVQLQLENMGEVGNVVGGTVIPAGSIGAIAGPRGAAPALEELTEQISYKAPVDRVSAVHVGSTLGVPVGAPDDELWGSLTVDGTATSDGERILLTNQTDATFNGIWIANAAYWERAEDFDEDAKCIPQSIIPVIGGTTYSDTVWMMTNDSVSLGVTNLAFSMIAGLGFNFRSSGEVGLGTPAATGALLSIGPATPAVAINIAKNGGPPAAVKAGDIYHCGSCNAFRASPGVDNFTQSFVGAVWTQTADVTVTNSGSLVGAGIGSLTFPANFFVAGKTIRVWARGTHTMDGSPPNVNWRVRLGGVTILETGAFSDNNNTDQYWQISCEMTVRTAGAGGTIMGQGVLLMIEGAGNTDTRGMVRTPAMGAAALNTTIANLLDVDVTYSAPDATSPITCTNLVVEVID